jgi:hypothetical protein
VPTIAPTSYLEQVVERVLPTEPTLQRRNLRCSRWCGRGREHAAGRRRRGRHRVVEYRLARGRTRGIAPAAQRDEAVRRLAQPRRPKPSP